MNANHPQSWEGVRNLVAAGEFLPIISTIWSEGGVAYSRIVFADYIAELAHQNDRRHCGEPYINHVRRTALRLATRFKGIDADDVIAALLHDVPEMHEDPFSLPRIKKLFGGKVHSVVAPVTQPDKKCFDGNHRAHERAKFQRVRAGGLRSIRIKIVDREDNTETLIGDAKHKRKQLRETIRSVLPLAKRYGIMYHELLNAIMKQYVQRHEDNRLV